MKKRINIKSIGYALMMLTMLLGFSACNNEDDVMEIFNDKTWKLSRITTEKGKEQFYQGCGVMRLKRKPAGNCSR